MKKLLMCAAGALALAAIAASAPALAAGSCSGWKNTCVSRCAGVANPNCVSNCQKRASTCRSTGCFFAAAESREYCGLVKK